MPDGAGPSISFVYNVPAGATVTAPLPALRSRPLRDDSAEIPELGFASDNGISFSFGKSAESSRRGEPRLLRDGERLRHRHPRLKNVYLWCRVFIFSVHRSFRCTCCHRLPRLIVRDRSMPGIPFHFTSTYTVEGVAFRRLHSGAPGAPPVRTGASPKGARHAV